jgi:hypothetical protein
VAETTVITLLWCGFGRTGKAMGRVYQCCWRICREINVFFFSRYEYHMLHVLYPFVTYLLTLPRIYVGLVICEGWSFYWSVNNLQAYLILNVLEFVLFSTAPRSVRRPHSLISNG